MTSSSTTQSPWQRCGVLTACAAALWVVLAGPAYGLAGTLGLEGLTYSALMCWLPGCFLFFVIPYFEFAKNKAYAFLAGLKEFLSWLVVFYSVTLLVETLLIVRSPESNTSSLPSQPVV
jgi:hypothetical protein